MLRAITNLLIRSTGWSAVGRRIKFLNGEGPLSGELVGAIGEVLNFKKGEKTSSDAFNIKLERPIITTHGELEHALLVPRHSGYSQEALATTPIRVYVFAVNPSLAEEAPAWDEMIAIMDVNLVR